MKQFSKGLVVRGSVAATSLIALVAVIGAGAKWW